MNGDLLRIQDELFSGMVDGGVVPFPLPIAQCNTLNATPYLVSLELFESRYGMSGPRRRLLASLRSVLDCADGLGAKLQGLLVGGSFLDGSIGSPRDLDCIYFYCSMDGAECASQLTALWHQAKSACIDIRFVPFDANPLFALKACSFFTVLYSRTRASAELSRGTVLIYRPPSGNNPETA